MANFTKKFVFKSGTFPSVPRVLTLEKNVVPVIRIPQVMRIALLTILKTSPDADTQVPTYSFPGHLLFLISVSGVYQQTCTCTA